MKHFPLNLQFFAESNGGGAGDGAGDGAGTPPASKTTTQQPATQTTTPNTGHQPSADDIAAAIFKAAEQRTQRAETSVVKSMAEQYGISEEEARAALEKAKSDKAGKLPDDVQKQLDEANAKVRTMQISAEVAKIGAELGLLDAETALLLIPADKIKVDDKGAVTGVKEALEALKKDKAYLFKAGGAGGLKQGEGAPPETDAKTEARNQMYHRK